MEDGSLIPEEARARVGSEISRAQGQVVKQDFQRWAASVKDRNPLYFDADFARADLDTLRPDGIPGRGPGDISLPRAPRIMGGGETILFHEPVYDGDTLTTVRVFENIEEKHGRSGPFVLVTMRTTYIRQDGITVAEAVTSTIARPL